jgi:hypothetical protein
VRSVHATGLLAALCIVSCTRPLVHIRGQMVDLFTREPLFGGQAHLGDAEASVDSVGNFDLTVPAWSGCARMRLGYIGYVGVALGVSVPRGGVLDIGTYPMFPKAIGGVTTAGQCWPGERSDLALVAGRVVDSSGAPVPYVRIRADCPRPRPLERVVVEVSSDNVGKFVLSVPLSPDSESGRPEVDPAACWLRVSGHGEVPLPALRRGGPVVHFGDIVVSR